MSEVPLNGKPQPFKIAGIGCYVPDTIVSNSDIAREFQIEPGLVDRQNDVIERRWVKEETPSWMGGRASIEAIGRAGLELEDIDLIVNASSTASLERIMPEGGALIQKQLGLADSGIPCFSLHANCLGFIQAIDLSGALLACGRFENILIVCSEILSKNLDPNYPDAVGMVGDGAAAAIVTLPSAGEMSSIYGIKMSTFGVHSDEICSSIGLEMFRGNGPGDSSGRLLLDLDSYCKTSEPYIKRFIENLSMAYRDFLSGVDLVISHHPGELIPEILEKEAGISRDRFFNTQERFGMFGAASIPIALCEAVSQGVISRGDRVLIVGAGAGISVAGVVFSY